jgi:hypothetical protein
MNSSSLLTLVQMVSAIWVLVFGSKAVYDLVKSKSRQEGQGVTISPLVIVNVVLAIGVLALSTTHFLLQRPPLPPSYPPAGWKLVYSDPMQINSGNWAVQSEQNGSSLFFNGSYQISAKSPWFYDSINPTTDFTTFAFEAQVRITQGDEGGILLRANAKTGNYYFFWVSQDQTYGFEIWQHYNFSNILANSSHTAIHDGFNHPNTVAVVAQRNTFTLYVNKQFIDTVTDKDSSLSQGSVGLQVDALIHPTQALFSNLKVWAPGS